MFQMTALRDLGVDPRKFHIVPTSEFMYYNLLEIPPTYLGAHDWNLVGIRRAQESPLLLDLRLLHVSADDFENPQFTDAERDAPGFFGGNPDQLTALIELLTGLVASPVASIPSTQRYFEPLGVDELTPLGFPSKWIRGSMSTFGTQYFRYNPDQVAETPEEIKLVKLSGWVSDPAKSLNNSVSFQRFSQHQLQNPAFSPLFARGLSTLRFNTPALQALIALLRTHPYLQS